MRSIQRIAQITRVTGAALGNSAAVSLQLNRRDIVIGVGIFVGPDTMGCTMTGLAKYTTVAFTHPIQHGISSCGTRSNHVFGKAFVGGYDRRGFGITGFPGLAQANTVGVAVGVHGIDQRPRDSREVAVHITRMAGTATGLVGPGYARLAARRIIEIALVQHEGVRIVRRDILREVVAHLQQAAVAIAAQHIRIEHRSAQAPGVLARMALIAVVVQCRLACVLVADVAVVILFGCRDGREQARELGMEVVHHPRVALVRHLVTPVGGAARGTRHRPDLCQIQRRRVVAYLAHHRLVLHQGLVDEATGRPIRDGAADGARVGRRIKTVVSRRQAVTCRTHVASPVLEIMQAQDIDIRRILDADFCRHIGIGIVQTGRHR